MGEDMYKRYWSQDHQTIIKNQNTYIIALETL